MTNSSSSSARSSSLAANAGAAVGSPAAPAAPDAPTAPMTSGTQAAPVSGSAPLDTLRAHSLTTALKEEIERLILDGELKAGERLNESVLAARYKTSRGPIREALQALKQQRLVTFEKNRGAFVREVSLQEAEELYDIRSALDEMVGRRLAERIDPADLARLTELTETMEAAAQAEDIARYYPANLAFHDLLLAATGNRRLMAIYRELINELHLLRRRGLSTAGALHESNHEHRDLLQAITAGDADAAALAMRRHIECARSRLRSAFEREAG